jgi:hypothetical protein
MQFLCFPYTQSEAPHPVVDSVVCPKIPLFHETERKSIEVNMYLLALILLLCTSSPNNITPINMHSKIQLANSTKKVTIKKHIQTVTEQMREQLAMVTMERDTWKREWEAKEQERETMEKEREALKEREAMKKERDTLKRKLEDMEMVNKQPRKKC